MGMIRRDGRLPLAKLFLYLQFLASSIGTTESAAGYKLIKANVKCNSPYMTMGTLSNASQCAASCRAQTDCVFFIFGLAKGPSGNRAGKCFQEKTAAASCSEGWQSDSYNFYELLPIGAPPTLVTTRRETNDGVAIL